MSSSLSPLLGRSEPHQLPNATREAMLQAGCGNALLILEGVYMLGCYDNVWMTYKQLFALLNNNFGQSVRLVESGLQCGQVFQRRIAKPRPNQCGRRPYEYRLPHPDELATEFAPDAKETPHDVLKKTDLRTLTTYRQALHRELFVRKWCQNKGRGFVMARGLMADRLGVSTRTVRSYDKALNHSNRPNIKLTEIRLPDLATLPRYQQRYTDDGKAVSRKEWLRITDWDTGESKNYPLVRYLAWRGLVDDRKVEVAERLPNTYYPYQRPDENSYSGQYSMYDPDFYWADVEAREAAGFYQKGEQWMYRRE